MRKICVRGIQSHRRRGNNALAGENRQMTDTSHLTALITRLGHERAALNRATKPQEIALRTVWVRQCEKEINSEERFLGMALTDWTERELTNEELMAELEGF